MNNREFDIRFDIYWNNIASNKAPGLNTYEKSVLLTKAQEDVVVSLYNGRNPLLEGFEQTEQLRRYLASIIRECSLSPLEPSDENPLPKGVDQKSKFFKLPENLWFITYESAFMPESENKCDSGAFLKVIPITQDQYHKVRKNPFRGAYGNKALRLDFKDNIVEIVSEKEIASYYVRYLEKLKPIVLETFNEDMTIDGIWEKTECQLDESLHDEILQRAVALAKTIWIDGKGQ
jgi:hypothetical protein